MNLISVHGMGNEKQMKSETRKEAITKNEFLAML